MAAPRILVIEDDKRTQDVLSLILGHAGYGVERASDGWEGLLKIETDRPDLVILDLMLPGIDGWEILRRLPSMQQPPPVVVLSAYLDRGRALLGGAEACLAKPFTIEDLVGTCARLLDPRRS